MSFDLNLPTTCKHKIYRELVELGQDKRTIRTAQPIASAGTVQLYASEVLIDDSLYSIIDDPEAIDVYKPRLIKFKSAWRAVEDYWEVCYVTLSGYCPICAGLKVIDDISLNVRGTLYLSRDERLLLQNLEKFVVTELGSNPFHSFVGTSIVSLLGEKANDRGFLTNRITQEINASLNRLKEMQGQYKKTGRPVTVGEQLDAVESVKVAFDYSDPTILRADITARAVSGKTVTFEQFLQLAEV